VLIALTCVGGAVSMLVLRGAVMNLGPGHEVGSALITPGTPYSLDYVTRSGDDSGVWLDLDLGYAQGIQLTGPLAVRVNGTVIAQYNVNMTSGECVARARVVDLVLPRMAQHEPQRRGHALGPDADVQGPDAAAGRDDHRERDDLREPGRHGATPSDLRRRVARGGTYCAAVAGAFTM
jgi:hypothetical protein